MTTQTQPALDVNAIPVELSQLAQWVVWRQESRDGGKPTKIPYNAATGSKASTTDPETWATFDDALAAYELGTYDGVGFVFSRDDDFAGVDLDDCINADGNIAPEAQKIIDELNSYTEVSPSGKGVKVFLQGQLPQGETGKNKKTPDIDGLGGIEVYDRGRYFTVTSRHLNGTPTRVEDRHEELNEVFRRFFPKRRASTANHTPTLNLVDLQADDRVERCIRYVEKCRDAISGNGGHNATLHAACECFRFGLSDGEAMGVLRLFNSTKTGGEEWSERELTHKLESAKAKVMADGEFGTRLAERPPKASLAVTQPPKKHGKSEVVLPSPAFKEFPVDVLPEPFAGYVREASEAIGCDSSFIATSLLVSMAGAIGNTRVIEVKPGWTEPAVIFAALVGESGDSKSPALDAGVGEVKRRQADAFKVYQEERARYEKQAEAHKARLSEWKKAGTKGDAPTEPQKPRLERFVVNDVTVEALADRLADNPRGLLLCRDELSGWFGSFDAYKASRGADVAHWLSMHRAQDLIVDRKHGDRTVLYIPRAAVSIIGGIQPETLRRSLGAEHFENGLAQRFLITSPPRRTHCWSERTVSQAVQGRITKVFDHLYGLSFNTDNFGRPEPVRIPFTTTGKPAYKKFYNEHAQEAAELSGELASAWMKLEAYCARFALVIHLVRVASHSPPPEDLNAIDAKSVESAVSLTRWFGHEIKRAYLALNGDDVQQEHRELAHLIQRKGGRITVRELMRSSRKYRGSVKNAEAALDGLADAGLASLGVDDHGGLGGRPVDVYELVAGGGDGNRTPQNSGASIVVSPEAVDFGEDVREAAEIGEGVL